MKKEDRAHVLQEDDIPSPSDIDLKSNLSGCFGKYEVEQAATELVKFMQENDAWITFRLEKFLKFCKQRGYSRPLFGLYGGWWDDAMLGGIKEPHHPYLFMNTDGKIAVTNVFLKAISKHVKAKGDYPPASLNF